MLAVASFPGEDAGMLAIALALLTVAADPLPAEKSMLRLSDAVDGSTLICIGTVERVDTLVPPEGWQEPEASGFRFRQAPAELTLGRVLVERVLKGDPATKVAYHEVWRSWTCDTTSAHVGERCLFFLGPGAVSDATPIAREALAARVGGAPILCNVGSGDGIVPITVPESGAPFVRFHGAPEEYGVEGHEKRGGLVRLSKVLEHVEQLARFAPELVVVRATSRRADDRTGFDYRILADGSTCFATGSMSPLRTSKLSERDWSALKSALSIAIGPAPIELGEARSYNPYRSLHVALPGVRLSFTDDDSVIVSGMEDAEFARYRATIDAWKLVHTAMDCADCVDHSARDAELRKR